MNEKTYDVITNFKHYTVSQAQVDACKRFMAGDEVIYLVRDVKTRLVRFNPALKRIVCTCSNGLEPTCWHRRASSVAERLYQETQRQK